MSVEGMAVEVYVPVAVTLELRPEGWTLTNAEIDFDGAPWPVYDNPNIWSAVPNEAGGDEVLFDWVEDERVEQEAITQLNVLLPTPSLGDEEAE